MRPTSDSVVLERDFLAQDIEDLIRRLEKGGRVVRDRHIVENVLLGGLPRSWKDLLKAAKARLYERPGIRLYSNEFRTSANNVDVELLTKNVDAHQIQVATLEKRVDISDDTLPLVEVVSAWAKKDLRTRRSQALLNGIAHEHWVQELSFIATERFATPRTPIGIWRFRIGALFPKPRGSAELRELIPEIRIELLGSAMLDDPRSTDCLCDVLKTLAESVRAQVAWALTSAAEDLDLYRDPSAQWPMAVVMSFPEGFGVVAQRAFAFGTAEERGGYRSAVMDQRSKVMRIVCLSGAVVEQPTEKPNSPNRIASPKPENAGDVFLLMEFGLKDVTLRKDGMMDRSIRLERYEEYLEEYGEKPEDILESLQVNVEELRQIADYKQAMSTLQDTADQWEWDVDDLKAVVWVSGVQRPHKEQPIIRLLIDLATGMLTASIVRRQESIVSFLERETSPGSRLGALPKHLKVAKTLLSTHPNIERWAAQQGVPLISPSSGADAGAKYVRLWNQLASGVIESECRTSWWLPQMLRYDSWRQSCLNWVADYCRDDGQSDDLTAQFIFGPRSLLVSDEHRAAFVAWRESNG